MGFPCGSAGKESASNVGDLGSMPGLGRSPGEGKGYPLQYSGLENSIDCIAHGLAKSWTQLSNLHFHMGLWIFSMLCQSLKLLFGLFSLGMDQSLKRSLGKVCVCVCAHLCECVCTPLSKKNWEKKKILFCHIYNKM